MKKLFVLPLLICCTGCLVSTSDPEAERAVELYNELHAHLPQESIDLKKALTMTDPADADRVRLAFAKLEMLRQNPRLPELRVWGEKARVELNVMLGFLPGDRIAYTTEGTLNIPKEISPVSAAEKAALIIDDGENPPLELLKKVHLAHAEAVFAMNMLMTVDTPLNRFSYLAACVRLASVIGVETGDLDKLEKYEKRFNAASSRWRKSLENDE